MMRKPIPNNYYDKVVYNFLILDPAEKIIKSFPFSQITRVPVFHFLKKG